MAPEVFLSKQAGFVVFAKGFCAIRVGLLDHNSQRQPRQAVFSGGAVAAAVLAELNPAAVVVGEGGCRVVACAVDHRRAGLDVSSAIERGRCSACSGDWIGTIPLHAR